jgi:hypothetical protein
MKIRKGIVAAFWISFFLPFTAPIYFGVSDEAIKPWRALELQRSSGGLEQDQLVLAGDMRQLRRDLRHRASDGIINFEREEIRQDWLDIAMDRGLNRDNRLLAPLDIARSPVELSDSESHRAG